MMPVNVSELINKIKINEKVKGLYLYGSFGIGKTYRIKELQKQMYHEREIGAFKDKIKVKISSIFVAWPDYVSAFKEKINGGNNNTLTVTELKKTTILFIDDLGGEIASDWELKELLFPILNYRIEHQLTTFFTSNFSVQDLEKYYFTKCKSDAVSRIIDRIYGLCTEIKMKGKNLRREKNW